LIPPIPPPIFPVYPAYLITRRVSLLRALISCTIPRPYMDPFPLSGASPAHPPVLPLSLYNILKQWVTWYEQACVILSDFPRAEEIEGGKDRGRSERVEEAFDWWVVIEGGGLHSGPGGDQGLVERHWMLIEVSEFFFFNFFSLSLSLLK